MQPPYIPNSYYDPYMAYYYQYYNTNQMNHLQQAYPFQYSYNSVQQMSNEIYGKGKEEQKNQNKNNPPISFNSIVNKKNREIKALYKNKKIIKEEPINKMKVKQKCKAIVEIKHNENNEIIKEIKPKRKRITTLKKKILLERKDYLMKHKKLNDTIPTLELNDKEVKDQKEEKKDQNVNQNIIEKAKIPSNNPREYVDQIITEELNLKVAEMILTLKKIYFKAKIERPDKKISKKYVFGIHEVLKHLKAENIKILICAPDIEKVEQSKGLDDVLINIFKRANQLKIPLVFALNQKKLGKISKRGGTLVSLIGVLQCNGVEEVFKEICTLSSNLRMKFYTNMKEKTKEMLENPFLNFKIPHYLI